MSKSFYSLIFALFIVSAHLANCVGLRDQDQYQSPISSPHIQSNRKLDVNSQTASQASTTNYNRVSDHVFQPRSGKAMTFLTEAKQSHLNPLTNLNNRATILDSESSSSSQNVDLQQQMVDLQTNVDGNIVKMQKNLQKTFEKSVNEMNRAIERATSKLVREIVNDTDVLNQTITEQTQFLHEQIHNDTEDLGAQIQVVNDDVDESIDYTQELTMIILSNQIDEKQAQLQKLDDKITQLESQMPPPPSICSMFSDCTSCLVNAQCGWCADSGSCVPGDDVGPLYAYCNFYSYQLCSSSGCGQYQNCSSCLTDPFCGWCNAPNLGITQCLESPATSAGCPSASWYDPTGNAQCPANASSPVALTNTSSTTASGDSELPMEIAKIQALQEELNKYEIEAQTVTNEITQLKAQLHTIKQEQLQRKTEAQKVKIQQQKDVEQQLKAYNASFHDKQTQNLTNGTNATNSSNTTNATNTTNSTVSATVADSEAKNDTETDSETDSESDSNDDTENDSETETKAETTTAQTVSDDDTTTHTTATTSTAKSTVSTVSTTSTAKPKTTTTATSTTASGGSS